MKREERELAGKKIPVVVTDRIARPGGSIPYAVAGIGKGLGLTLGYFTRPGSIVTRQYPENRKTLSFPDRYRARLVMLHDDHGYHNCTACKICERACPNSSIKVVSRRSPVTNKLEIDHYIYRQDSCLVCNACVQACPFGAIEMGQEFESAVYDRRLLIYGLNRYAGPPANILLKESDPDARKRLMEPRGPFDGPVPLGGAAYPHIRPLKPEKKQP